MSNNTNERNLIKEALFYLLFAVIVAAVIFLGFFIYVAIENYMAETKSALELIVGELSIRGF